MSDCLEGLRVLLDSLQSKDPKELSLEGLAKELVYLFEKLENLLPQYAEDQREAVIEEMGVRMGALLSPFVDLTKKNVSQLLNLSHQIGSEQEWVYIDEAKTKILEIGERIGKGLLKAPPTPIQGDEPTSSLPPSFPKVRPPRRGRWMRS